MSIEALRCDGPGIYRLDLVLGDDAISYRFTVSTHSGIDVVNWDRAFQSLIDENVGKTEPILAAVLAFHRARGCVLSIPKGRAE